MKFRECGATPRWSDRPVLTSVVEVVLTIDILYYALVFPKALLSFNRDFVKPLVSISYEPCIGVARPQQVIDNSQGHMYIIIQHGPWP